MITFETIRAIVCNGENITPEQLIARNRCQELVLARYLVAYFCHKYTLLSSNHIGRLLKLDHTTILYALKVIKNLIETNKCFRDKVYFYESQIGKLKSFEKEVRDEEFKNIADVIINSINKKMPISSELLAYYNWLISLK